MAQGRWSKAAAVLVLAVLGATAAGARQAASVTSTATVSGGRLHGVVKSGTTPLPGVTVTARHALTGKKYSTTTDVRGQWQLNLAQNGHYVVRTELAGFAVGVSEAVVNASTPAAETNFELTLASRTQPVEATGEAQNAHIVDRRTTMRTLEGRGAQSLSLESTLSADTEAQTGTQTGSAELPTAAASADVSSESVAISGQSGQVSASVGQGMDRMRDAMEMARAQGGGQPGGLFGGGFGGGGGGFGGPGGMMGGGPGGGRGNFRGFNAAQPHGAIFWSGSNSALNAKSFSLRGQSQEQPASGTNKFGITFMSAPYLPGLTKPSGKDSIFLSLNGQRSSTPSDQYAMVPTVAERGGDFSASGLAKIYNPATQAQFAANGEANVIPLGSISPQATALLNYFPAPNLSGNDSYNYHLLTTAQTNITMLGARYMRTLGKNASMNKRQGFSSRRTQSQGLRQSINFNYNWTRTATDNVNLFPELGGKTQSASNSLSAGYTLGYHRINSIFTVNWNRSHSEVINFFTGKQDITTDLGMVGENGTALHSSALNYGLPNITLSSLTGLTEQQPDFSTQQTLSVSETVSWRLGKHNVRFGGDYRRVHNDLLGGSNATGTFTFTGLFTENASGSSSTGSALADFLLGLPQETTINTSAAKSYLRDNVLDGYAMDDWRVNSQLTMNLGVRYEYFAPYTEKNGHLAMVDTNPSGAFTSETEVQAGGAGSSSGRLPDGLVFGNHKAVSPRVGIAWRVPWIPQTVLRGGYGINFMVGQYGSFASTLAHEPMPNDASFVNEQTNLQSSSACARSTSTSCLTLAEGFGAPDTVGNYGVDPHYKLPYVQTWNVNLQKTLPWSIVLNVGYNGSKGSNLATTIAPWETTASTKTNPNDVSFTYAMGEARSRFQAGTLSVQKRLSGGLALGAFYKYAHAIDNAAAPAQNWQDLGAEESNSSYDVRHTLNGNYLYQLPFGYDKTWATSGLASRLLEGFSISGTFKFASGSPLTPSYQASVTDVARGTAGTQRPDRVAGQSVTAGGGSSKKWFNTGAFTTPTGDFGTASRYSISGPGTLTNDMTLSKTMQMGSTRSWELRATATNVFNTVQYSGVDTNVSSSTFGQVSSTGDMRKFQFETRFRF
jgi:hypothetical protein